MRNWNRLLSAVTLTATFLVFWATPASAETTFTNTSCSTSNVVVLKTFALHCPVDQRIHVVSKLQSSNCSYPKSAANRLAYSNETNLTVGCEPGAVSTCQETVAVGIPVCSNWNCKEHFLKLTYECIEETNIFNMCQDYNLTVSSGTLYLASPSLFSRTSSEGICRCAVNGSGIAVQVLYASAKTPLALQSDTCQKRDQLQHGNTINSDYCPNSQMSRVDVKFNYTQASNALWAWIRIKGRAVSLQCKRDTPRFPTPPTTTVVSTDHGEVYTGEISKTTESSTTTATTSGPTASTVHPPAEEDVDISGIIVIICGVSGAAYILLFFVIVIIRRRRRSARRSYESYFMQHISEAVSFPMSYYEHLFNDIRNADPALPNLDNEDRIDFDKLSEFSLYSSDSLSKQQGHDSGEYENNRIYPHIGRFPSVEKEDGTDSLCSSVSYPKKENPTKDDDFKITKFDNWSVESGEFTVKEKYCEEPLSLENDSPRSSSQSIDIDKNTA